MKTANCGMISPETPRLYGEELEHVDGKDDEKEGKWWCLERAKPVAPVYGPPDGQREEDGSEK